MSPLINNNFNKFGVDIFESQSHACHYDLKYESEVISNYLGEDPLKSTFDNIK